MAEKPTYEDLEQRVKDLEKQASGHERSEEALQASEEKFRALSEAAFETIFLSEKGICLGQNVTAEKMFGYTPSEAIGRPGTDWISPESREMVRNNMLSGHERPYEAIALRKDGSTFPVEIQGKVICYQDREIRVTSLCDITNRVLAEKALRESEEKYRSLIETITDMFFIISPNGNFTYLNPEFEKLTGYLAQDFIGHSFTEILAPEYIESTVDRFKRGLSGETIPIYEVALKQKYGKTVPVELKVTSLLGDDGKAIGRIGLARDITDRRKAEEALRESEEKFSSFAEQSLVGIYLISGDVFKYVNPKFAEIFGYSVDECLNNMHFPQLVHPEDLATVEKQVGRRLSEETKSVQYPFRGIKKSGETIHVEIFGSSMVLKGKTVATGTMLDITARKQAEEALRGSEEKYRSMMEAMKDPVYICSSDYRVEYMNPTMIRRTGRDAIGEHCFKALHGLDEKCSWCMHDKAQQGEHLELEIVSPKDNRSYYISQSPVAHGDGSISKMTVWRDTTAFRTLETQLQQAQKMEAIGTLAGGIAHDFNNILGGIIGYAELAKMKAPEGSNVIAYLDKMIKSSDRAADLIKQILTLSRRHKQKQRPVQVKHIVKDALDLLRATLPTTIEIRKDVAKDTGVVNADPTQMHQVIMNLTTNAGHAMQENGGVLEVILANVELDDLSASKHLDLTAGFYLRLTVSDTGHGMTPETMERIFDPYFTTKDTGEGTGLGLSVAHGIVKTHGGTITVYSEPGKGTTFHVYLPVILELERAEKGSEEPLPTGSERILFIDDEEVLLEIGSQILEQLGYEVVTKISSVQALALFRAEPDRFALVITDMTMPDMTGDKLARELMKIRPDIPIILCTGHNTLVLEEKAKEIGVKAFVMKPLVMRNLAETVRKVLDEK